MDGELTSLGKWFEKISDLNEEWKRRNHNNTAAIEQAAKDKHLFYNMERNRHIELTYPEYVPAFSCFLATSWGRGGMRQSKAS